MGAFGLTPEMVPLMQQQEDTAAGIQAGQLGPTGAIISAANVGGNMIGRGLAGAMGYQDPRIQQAQRFQAAMHETETSGLDFSKDPAGYMGLAAKNLMKYGLYDQGMHVVDKIKEMQQGQLAGVQTNVAIHNYNQQTEADKITANIMTAAQGDESKAAKAMRVSTNPLVRKAGEELDAKRFVPVGANGLYDTRQNSMVPGSDTVAQTELGKYQTQRESIRKAIADGKANGQPQAYLDGLQQNLEEADSKIKLLSEGTPKSAMDERAMKRLMSQQLVTEFGLTPDQAAMALNGNTKGLVSAGVDPRTVSAVIAKTQKMQAETDQAILNQQHMIIDPVTQKPMYIQPLQVPNSITVGKAGASAGNAPGVPVNQVPSMEGGRRPLDAGTEKKFSDMGSGLQQIDMLKNGFKDEYGGFVSKTAADLAIEMGRRGVSKWADTADFWQTYRQWGTDIRALKFGLTLTPAELKSFESFTVNPSDSPTLIKRNIQKQEDLVNAAAQRELKGLNISGQNVKQGEALSGVTMITKQPVFAAPVKTPPQPTQYGQPGDGVQQTVVPAGAGGGSVDPISGAIVKPMTATNPKTGVRILSNDGGKTWQKAP